MSIFNYIAFSILGIYSFIIGSFAFGWFKLKIFKPAKRIGSIPVSIIIACRNEEKNISFLIESILIQTYPNEKTEIIIVDDHSDDNSIAIVENYFKNYGFIKLLKLPDHKTGKKAALAYGIEESSSEIIITTDADCIMQKDWLRSLISYYQIYKPRLLVGPVTFTYEQSLFQKFQSLEFLSLIASGAGAIGINHPIMNNGANLLFDKALFSESNKRIELASGDDMFLLLHSKKHYKKSVHFIKSKEAIVYTQPTASFKDFLNQRIRWTSKSKAYRDFDIIFTALITSLTSLIIVLALGTSIWHSSAFKTFLELLIIKSIFDLMILIPASRFFHQQKLIWHFIPLQLLYPFYIILTVISGLLGNFNWKGRKFKEKR